MLVIHTRMLVSELPARTSPIRLAFGANSPNRLTARDVRNGYMRLKYRKM